jgi:hypothetical protein
LLTVTKLDKLIVAYESEDVAVASFPSPDGGSPEDRRPQP